MRSPVAPRGALWAVPVALCFVLAASCSDGGGEASDDEGNAGENGNGGSAGSSGANGGTSGAASGGSSGTGGGPGGNGGAGGSTGGAGGVGGGVGGAGGAGGVTGGAGGVTGGGAGMENGGGVGGASAGASGGGAGGAAAAGGAGGAAGGSTGGGAGDAAGGSAGAGPVLCGSAFVVADDGFVKAPPVTGPCWYGYATAGGDSGSTVTPTSFATCGAGCMLRASGTVNAAVEPDYAGVVYLGFNLKQEPSTSTIGTVTPTGSGLVVNYTNTGASPTVRIQIASGTTRWCATLTASPVTVPWAMFNTECWEGGAGTAYAKQPIDTVQLVIPGGAASAPFDVTLVSVKDT